MDVINLGNWAAKISAARALYGADSTYVIGLVTALEWVCEQAEGGAALKAQLHRKIVEAGEGAATGPGPIASPSQPASPPNRRPAAAPVSNENLVENSWINGVVKWFNNDKGYGFISTDGNTDVFVHWRDISTWDRSLSQGDAVEFMVTRTAKGFQAINVMKPGAEGQEGQEGQEGVEDGEGAEAAIDAEAVPPPPPPIAESPAEEPSAVDAVAEAHDDAEEQNETG